jgi:phage-related protein
MQIFGKSAQDLKPLFAVGSEGIRAFAQEARDMGAVMGEESLSAFGDLDDNMQRLKATQEGLAHTMGGLLLPELTNLSGIGVTLLGNFSKAMQDASGDPEQMSKAIADGLSGALESVNSAGPYFMEALTGLLGSVVTIINDNLPILINLAKSVITQVISAIGENAPMLAESAAQIISTLVNALIALLPQLAEIGMPILAGLGEALMSNIETLATVALQLLEFLVTGLIAALPQLTGAAVDIITKLAEMLIDNLPLLIGAAIQIILALVDGIVEALPTLVPAAVDAVLTIAEGLIDNIDLLIDAAIALIIGLAEGVIASLPELISRVPEIIVKLVDALIENIPKLLAAAFVLVVALAKGIIDNLPEIARAAKDIITRLGAGLIESIAILNTKVDELIASIVGWFKDKDWGQTGRDILEGIKNGLLKGVEIVTGAVREVGQSIMDGVKGFFKMNSPSKLMEDEVGAPIMQGWEHGISKNKKLVVNATAKVAKDSVEVAESAGNEIVESAKKVTQELEKETKAQEKLAEIRRSITAEITKLNDDYNKSLDSTAEKIVDAYGLFDSIEPKEAEDKVKGSDFLNSLESQVKALEQWSIDMADLAARGMDRQLLEELRAMGPKSAEQIAALNSLTDAELERYNRLFIQKNQVARETAERELSDTRKAMEEQTKALADALQGTTMEPVVKIQADFSGIVEAGKNSMSEIKETEPEWKEEGSAVMESLRIGINEVKPKLVNDMSVLGAATMEGLAQGLSANSYRPLQVARDIARQIAELMRATLGVESPSKVTRAIGRFVSEGLAIGMLDAMPLVRQAAQKVGLAAEAEPTITQPGVTGVEKSVNVENNITNNITVASITQLPYQIDRANRRALRGVSNALVLSGAPSVAGGI